MFWKRRGVALLLVAVAGCATATTTTATATQDRPLELHAISGDTTVARYYGDETLRHNPTNTYVRPYLSRIPAL